MVLLNLCQTYIRDVVKVDILDIQGKFLLCILNLTFSLSNQNCSKNNTSMVAMKF